MSLVYKRNRFMPTPQELQEKLWKALASDRVVMLGLDGAEEGHTRPMSAQTEGDKSPLWFFTAKDSQMVKLLGNGQRAIATFTAKGHDLFASLQGTLRLDNDRRTIDRLWNRFVAAWYEGGKDDPNLALLRFDATRAEVWENENSVIAGIKLMLGADPKKDAQDKVASVDLR
jgi:general stress protein 26